MTQFNTMLVLECITNGNIYICSRNGDIPFWPIDGCPKDCCVGLLEDMTGIKINPDEDWLTLELEDTYYDNIEETAYIIYVCRVGEKLPLKHGYEWSDFMTMKPKLDKLKSLI